MSLNQKQTTNPNKTKFNLEEEIKKSLEKREDLKVVYWEALDFISQTNLSFNLINLAKKVVRLDNGFESWKAISESKRNRMRKKAKKLKRGAKRFKHGSFVYSIDKKEGRVKMAIPNIENWSISNYAKEIKRLNKEERKVLRKIGEEKKHFRGKDLWRRELSRILDFSYTKICKIIDKLISYDLIKTQKNSRKELLYTRLDRKGLLDFLDRIDQKEGNQKRLNSDTKNVTKNQSVSEKFSNMTSNVTKKLEGWLGKKGLTIQRQKVPNANKTYVYYRLCETKGRKEGENYSVKERLGNVNDLSYAEALQRAVNYVKKLEGSPTQKQKKKPEKEKEGKISK